MPFLIYTPPAKGVVQRKQLVQSLPLYSKRIVALELANSLTAHPIVPTEGCNDIPPSLFPTAASSSKNVNPPALDDIIQRYNVIKFSTVDIPAISGISRHTITITAQPASCVYVCCISFE